MGFSFAEICSGHPFLLSFHARVEEHGSAPFLKIPQLRIYPESEHACA